MTCISNVGIRLVKHVMPWQIYVGDKGHVFRKCLHAELIHACSACN